MIARILQKVSSTFGLTTEEFKKAALIPLGFIVLIIIGDVIWRALGFPGPDETILLIKGLFIEHGYPLVFLSALVEALLLVGLYLPGSVALILSAALAGQGVLNIWLVILFVILGSLLGVTVNYVLGRYGWYKLLVKFGLKNSIEKMKIRAEAKGTKLIHITYFNPNLATLSATSFGILHMNFGKFILHSLLAFTYWSTIWGLLFFFLGDWVEERMNYTNLLILLVIVIFVRIAYIFIKKKVGLQKVDI